MPLAHRLDRVAPAGAAFVVAWIVGLLVAPASPPLDASEGEITARLADHGVATAIQSLLIHGLAGVALIVIATTLGAGRVATAAGLVAGITSLGQAVLGVLNSAYLAVHASDAAVATVWDAINLADTFKLFALAVFIWTATRAMTLPMRRAGAVIAPLQAIGGLAFVTGSTALYAVLYLALPALVIWVGWLAYQASRSPSARVPGRSGRAAGEAGGGGEAAEVLRPNPAVRS